MAIKWKNNKYKGILAVLLCTALTGVMMCNLYPVFWQKAQKRAYGTPLKNGQVKPGIT